MHYLAIDLGDRRTGLAVADDETGLVSPAGVLEIPRGPRLLEAIIAEIGRHAPAAIVVGLPLNMDGTEGERSVIARAFGRQLEDRAALPVHYQDERLTSYAADQVMARSGRTHRQKKQLRNALAAVEVLRDFLARISHQHRREGA